MSIDQITMCQQLGRYLGAVHGHTFVEPDSSDKGTIYAAPLPAAKYRNARAVSIVTQPSATNEPMSVTQRIQIVMHAVAQTDQIAMAMLMDYARTLWPNNRPHVLVQGDLAPGIVGVPAAEGIHPIWRIVNSSQLDHPSIKPRTEEGLAAASFAFEVHAVQTTVTVE